MIARQARQCITPSANRLFTVMEQNESVPSIPFQHKPFTVLIPNSPFENDVPYSFGFRIHSHPRPSAF